jgi:hypothetical protein
MAFHVRLWTWLVSNTSRLLICVYFHAVPLNIMVNCMGDTICYLESCLCMFGFDLLVLTARPQDHTTKCDSVPTWNCEKGCVFLGTAQC